MPFDAFEQLRDAIKRGDAIGLRRYLEQGDPNLHNAAGETPLFVAAAAGQSHLVELLLLAGARVNDHRYGRTPLYAASINGHTRTVDLLLKSGADPQILIEGRTIAHWLSQYDSKYRSIVELLNAPPL